MKIGIITDTHDNLRTIRKAVEFFNREHVEHVLHAGDYVAPFALKALGGLKCTLTGVFGNNDGDKIVLLNQASGYGFSLNRTPFSLTIGNRSILLLHEPYELDAFIKSECYHLIVYGHTHRPDLRKVASTLILNPGECGGWLEKPPRVGIVDLPGLEGRIKDLSEF
jgi:putative phosphoesterase